MHTWENVWLRLHVMHAGLEPATDYSFRVRACNAAGQSPWSDSCVIRSAAAAPSCPLHLVAEGATLLMSFMSFASRGTLWCSRWL